MNVGPGYPIRRLFPSLPPPFLFFKEKGKRRRKGKGKKTVGAPPTIQKENGIVVELLLTVFFPFLFFLQGKRKGRKKRHDPLSF